MCEKKLFLTLTLVILLLSGTFTLAQMRKLTIDAGNIRGTIRNLQGVNRGPLSQRINTIDLTKQYRDIGVAFVRTHDFHGPTDIYQVEKGKVVPGTIFPNWDADPEKPGSYDFGPSDRIIKGIIDAGAQVYYRLGQTFSNDPTVPWDFDKYTNICRHVVMHYNGGWANGFHYNIRYWEFWNEPNIAPDWTPGTFPVPWGAPAISFFKLYEKVARAIKSYDPSLKVGACGLAEGQRESLFREGFISYCADNKVPLDFYSWHHYSGDSNDPYDFTRVARVVRSLLDDNGFLEAENHCSEWNLTVESRDNETMLGGAFVCSAMIYMQDDLDLSLYYAGPTGSMGLFENNGLLRKKAYAFKACGQMLDTPQRLEVGGDDTYGFAVLAGRSADAKMVQVLISNYEIHTPAEAPRQTAAPGSHGLMRRKGIRNDNKRGYELTISNLPWGKGEFTIRRYRITEKENLDPVDEITGKGGIAEVKSELPPPGIELVLIRKK